MHEADIEATQVFIFGEEEAKTVLIFNFEL